MTVARYLVAGCMPWNRRLFDEHLAASPGSWSYVTTPQELLDAVDGTPPDLAFFLHWRWIVPPAVTSTVECVNFHMTDVPFGRGGSPLQNLLASGIEVTKLSAIRMTDKLDAGPVYLKRTLVLEGTAESIYIRASALAVEMIQEIIEHRPEPVPQTGEPVVFRRRRPEESRISTTLTTLDELHHFIRMLDAEGYPHAVLEHGAFRFEFRRSARYHDRLEADVSVTIAR